MSKNTKLELTWIGKENRPKLEPRILIEDPDKSHHAARRVADSDIFENRLIHGDNLLALKALEQEFAGRFQCAYLDPPFNTQQAFEHYPDGLEHSVWLQMMRDRLELVHRLMAPTGSLFIHIDDNELGYLLVVADEVFGRGNRINIITFKQSSASGPKAINPGLVTTSNFILYYVKDKQLWKPNRVYTQTDRDTRYATVIQNPDEPYKKWRLEPLRSAFARSHSVPTKDLRRHFGDDLDVEIDRFVLSRPNAVVRLARVAPVDVNESARRVLAESQQQRDEVFRADREGKEPYYFMNGEQLIFYSSKVREIDGEMVTGEPLTTVWDDLLSNNLHAEGSVQFPNGKKPESLLKRVIELSTKPGDWVLDSFAGSGTTAAVAHKTRRKWVAIEMREHCQTHIHPRMKAVVEGTDPSGVTAAAKWLGGGGFRYYRLAPSLLERDQWDNWVISRQFNPAMLAEAVCKLEGFTYAPSQEHYWEHGHSTERDYIYVTTQKLTHQQLHALAEEVGPERSLLVCCAAFRGTADQWPNLTLKKIPKAVMERCEWGRDDYSLSISKLPAAESLDADGDEEPPTAKKKAAPKKAKVAGQADLFGGEGEEA